MMGSIAPSMTGFPSSWPLSVDGPGKHCSCASQESCVKGMLQQGENQGSGGWHPVPKSARQGWQGGASTPPPANLIVGP